SYFGERLAALLIDGLLLGAIWFPIRGLLSWDQQLGSPALSALLQAAYFVLLEGPLGQGQTLGKKLLGLRVLTVSGQLLSYRQSFRRVFFKEILISLLSVPAFFVYP